MYRNLTDTNVFARWVARTTVLALCCGASGCDLIFYSTAYATGEGYYQSVKPRLTDQGKGVHVNGQIEECRWIGYETVKINKWRTLDAGTMQDDQLTVARNFAPLMEGNTLVETEAADEHGARYDVYKCPE